MPRIFHSLGTRLFLLIFVVFSVSYLEKSSGLLEDTTLEKDIYLQAKTAKSHLEIYKLSNKVKERKERKDEDQLSISSQIASEKNELSNGFDSRSKKNYLSKIDEDFGECIKQDNFKKWPEPSQSFWSCTNQYSRLIESDLSKIIYLIEIQKKNKSDEFWTKIIFTSITILAVTYALNFLDVNIEKNKSSTDKFEKIDHKEIQEFISGDELEYLRSSLACVFSDLAGQANFEIKEETKNNENPYAKQYFDYIDVPPSNVLYKQPSKDLVLE